MTKKQKSSTDDKADKVDKRVGAKKDGNANKLVGTMPKLDNANQQALAIKEKRENAIMARYPDCDKRPKDMLAHFVKCPVCQHDKLDDIEHMYVSWVGTNSICSAFDLPVRSLNGHWSYYALDKMKMRKREAWALKVLESAPIEETKVSEAIDLFKHMDKRDGLIKPNQVNVGVGISIGPEPDVSNYSKEKLETIEAEFETPTPTEGKQ